VQLIRSTDLRRWEWLGEALPALPAWASRNRTWAPAVLARPGGYVLYYTVRHRDSGHQCISVATSARPGGPFVDTSAAPFLCQHELGGSIDPSPVVDAAGHPFLVWKSEGETVGGRAELWSAPLRGDGLALAGFPARLLTAGRSWEGRTIEGPSMVRVGGGYSLFYSANSWNSSGYSIGHATCFSPVGPCQRSGNGPLLSSLGRSTGPGGPEALWVGDRLHLAFHAWRAPDIGYPNRRKLFVRPVAFDGLGRPSVVLSP
jgi:beta-xylosidase